MLAALAIGSTAGCPALLGLGELTFRDNVPVDGGGAGGGNGGGPATRCVLGASAVGRCTVE